MCCLFILPPCSNPIHPAYPPRLATSRLIRTLQKSLLFKHQSLRLPIVRFRGEASDRLDVTGVDRSGALISLFFLKYVVWYLQLSFFISKFVHKTIHYKLVIKKRKKYDTQTDSKARLVVPW